MHNSIDIIICEKLCLELHHSRVQGLDLVLGHYMVLGALEFRVSEHNTIFFGAQAPVLGHGKCEPSLRMRSSSFK